MNRLLRLERRILTVLLALLSERAKRNEESRLSRENRIQPLPSAPAHFRRIAIIGWDKQGVALEVVMRHPTVNYVVVENQPHLLVDAMAACKRLGNLQVVNGNPARIAPVVCDRIIYNRCLSRLNGGSFAFRKLLAATTDWLVDEGDVIVRETPRLWLNRNDLIDLFRNILWPVFTMGRIASPVENFIRQAGFFLPLQQNQPWADDIGGSFKRLADDICLHAFKTPVSNPALPTVRMTPNRSAKNTAVQNAPKSSFRAALNQPMQAQAPAHRHTPANVRRQARAPESAFPAANGIFGKSVRPLDETALAVLFGEPQTAKPVFMLRD